MHTNPNSDPTSQETPIGDNPVIIAYTDITLPPKSFVNKQLNQRVVERDDESVDKAKQKDKRKSNPGRRRSSRFGLVSRYIHPSCSCTRAREPIPPACRFQVFVSSSGSPSDEALMTGSSACQDNSSWLIEGMSPYSYRQRSSNSGRNPLCTHPPSSPPDSQILAKRRRVGQRGRCSAWPTWPVS